MNEEWRGSFPQVFVCEAPFMYRAFGYRNTAQIGRNHLWQFSSSHCTEECPWQVVALGGPIADLVWAILSDTEQRKYYTVLLLPCEPKDTTQSWGFSPSIMFTSPCWHVWLERSCELSSRPGPGLALKKLNLILNKEVTEFLTSTSTRGGVLILSTISWATRSPWRTS